MDCSSSSKIQNIHSVSETVELVTAVPGAVVMSLELSVQSIITKSVRRESVAMIRPNNPCYNGMEDALDIMIT